MFRILAMSVFVSVLCFPVSTSAEDQSDEIMRKVIVPCFMDRAKTVMNRVRRGGLEEMYKARFGVKFKQKDIAWQLIRGSKRAVDGMIKGIPELVALGATKGKSKKAVYRDFLSLCKRM